MTVFFYFSFIFSYEEHILHANLSDSHKNTTFAPDFVKRMLKSRYIFIPLMLLTLFMAYQVSITMFAHVHYVNGVMIVHSHPSADSEHTHTQSQILTLAQMSEWTGTEPVFVTLSEVALSVFDTIECERKSDTLPDTCSHCISLRAPPVYC